MEFHISCHHTPNNCGVHRHEPDGTRSPNAVPNWAEHCKEVGVTYIKGGVNAPHITISCLWKQTIWPNCGI